VDVNMNYLRRERYLKKELGEGVQIVPLNIYELHSYEKEEEKMEYLEKVLRGEGLKQEQEEEGEEEKKQIVVEDGEEEGEQQPEEDLEDLDEAEEEEAK